MTMDLFALPAAATTDESVHDEVIQYQPSTDVFVNEAGGVTIKQDHIGWMGDSDVMVVMTTKEAVRAVIKALQQKLEEM